MAKGHGVHLDQNCTRHPSVRTHTIQTTTRIVRYATTVRTYSGNELAVTSLAAVQSGLHVQQVNDLSFCVQDFKIQIFWPLITSWHIVICRDVSEILTYFLYEFEHKHYTHILYLLVYVMLTGLRPMIIYVTELLQTQDHIRLGFYISNVSA